MEAQYKVDWFWFGPTSFNVNPVTRTHSSENPATIELPLRFRPQYSVHSVSMIACRVRLLSRTRSVSGLALFSSSTGTRTRFSNFYSDETEGGSAVYRHILKFQRPTTIRWQPQLENSVSFIGSVVSPLETFNTRSNSFGSHAVLQVQNPPHTNDGLRIRLEMWDDLAKLCQKHLKPNDFIYVSGRLQSYEDFDEKGNPGVYYKVNVKELNYVTRHDRSLTSQKIKESKSGKGESGIEKKRNQYYLWHLYFSKPYEWWDNRKQKLSPGAPDFKHKDTGEALWLNQNDPPWIRRQLQMLDSKMAEQGLGSHEGSRSGVSMWVYDD